MRAFKVVFTYCAKQAEVFSFVVGFYLIFIFQALTGISGSNLSNLLLVLFSFGLGYLCYKGLSKVPVRKFELEEQELGKLQGLDLFLFWLIIAVFVFILFYFSPVNSGESEFLRHR
jgi:hypothetical protein